jgi:lipoate-protein ligase B
MNTWDAIIPCGLAGVQMACVADFVNPPDMVDVARLAAEELGDVLGYSVEWMGS